MVQVLSFLYTNISIFVSYQDDAITMIIQSAPTLSRSAQWNNIQNQFCNCFASGAQTFSHSGWMGGATSVHGLDSAGGLASVCRVHPNPVCGASTAKAQSSHMAVAHPIQLCGAWKFGNGKGVAVFIATSPYCQSSQTVRSPAGQIPWLHRLDLAHDPTKYITVCLTWNMGFIPLTSPEEHFCLNSAEVNGTLLTVLLKWEKISFIELGLYMLTLLR